MYGYIEDFCLSCTNGGKNVALSGQQVWPRQTITYDNYKVQLPSKCTYALTKKANFNHNIDIDYDVDAIGLDRDIAWSKIFTNGDTKNCPILDCKLYNTGCTADYNGPALTLEGGNVGQDWNIKVNDQVYDGFTANYCLYCNNEYQRIWQDNLAITQSKRCTESGKLVAKNFRAINSPAWRFDADKGDTKIADSSDLFDNTDPDNTKCLVNKCTVYQSNCATPWNFLKDKGFKMSASAPFTITYDSKVNHGYKYDLCVKCDNPQMSATNKFSIQQESRCLPSYNLLAKNPFKLTPTEITKYDEAKANGDQETLDQKPTKYAYVYESDFSSSEDPVKGEEETAADFQTKLDAYVNLNFVDVGFNANKHTKLYSGLDDTEENQITDHSLTNDYKFNETTSLFFQNSDKTNCDYKKCELMAQGCQWPYTQTKHLEM